jgi:SHS2 domain-containing protein
MGTVVQAGGSDLREAFENVGLAMFNYMTPLSGITIDEEQTK